METGTLNRNTLTDYLLYAMLMFMLGYVVCYYQWAIRNAEAERLLQDVADVVTLAELPEAGK